MQVSVVEHFKVRVQCCKMACLTLSFAKLCFEQTGHLVWPCAKQLVLRGQQYHGEVHACHTD